MSGRSFRHLPAWLTPGYTKRNKDATHYRQSSISSEDRWRSRYENVDKEPAGKLVAIGEDQDTVQTPPQSPTTVCSLVPELIEVDLNAEVIEKPHDCSKFGCQRVIINVSGMKFETQLRTLERFPATLLGDSTKRQMFWDERRNEYFIDRHRPSFPGIIYFYQSGGRLHRPTEVSEDIFLEEMIFYELGDAVINEYKEKEGFVMEEKKMLLPQMNWQRHMWLFCEEPDSSWAAKVFAVASIICILISIICFCMETIPRFSHRSLCLNITSDEDPFEFRLVPNYLDHFFVIETVCVTWFSVEFLLRLISCPSKLSFCKNIMNIFDLLAIVPFFVSLVIQLCGDGSCDDTAKKGGSFVFVRVLRVFRIFKLSKHSQGLRILGLTIKTSLRELGMFFFFLIIAMVIFSSAVYYAEAGQPETKLISIPDSFWWAIITMTTVGYGDLCPIGVWGKLVGTLCVIAGVLTIALPVPIVVANFNNFYRHESGKG